MERKFNNPGEQVHIGIDFGAGGDVTVVGYDFGHHTILDLTPKLRPNPRYKQIHPERLAMMREVEAAKAKRARKQAKRLQERG